MISKKYKKKVLFTSSSPSILSSLALFQLTAALGASLDGLGGGLSAVNMTDTTPQDLDRELNGRKFKIKMLNRGPRNRRYTKIFKRCAARWSRLIGDDLPDLKNSDIGGVDWFGNTFEKGYFGKVDDLVVGFSIEKIDGPSGIVGSAGPIHTQPPFFARSGIIRFDEDDIGGKKDEDIELICVHEIGHILGVGTFSQQLCGRKCKPGGKKGHLRYGSGAPSNLCQRARSEFKKIKKNHPESVGGPLIFEGEGGAGTACGHWAEETFLSSDEIMTGIFHSGREQLMSTITLGCLVDLGYKIINFDLADNFPSPQHNFTPPLDGPSLSPINNVNNMKPMVASETFNLEDMGVMMKPKMKVMSPNH